MILISTVFKGSKTGGVYHCEVFEVGVSPSNDKKYVLINLTKGYAEKFGLLYKHNVIQIFHGSGTGFNVLKKLIVEGSGISRDQVVDVSVFGF